MINKLFNKLNRKEFSSYNCTPDHEGNNMEKTILTHFLSNSYAEQVFVGDEVLAERDGKLMNAKVIDVSSEILQGNENYQLFLLLFMFLH